MRFQEPLIEGTLIARDERFMAVVRLDNGEEVEAHCANRGALLGVSKPGSRVLVSLNQNPRRRVKHQLEIIYSNEIPVGVHQARPADLVAERIMAGDVEQVLGYATMRRDGQASGEPIDLLLEGNGLRPCYIDVRGVTYAENSVAMFPDLIDFDHPDRLSELVNLVREGNRAILAFVAQRSDVASFRPADRIDPEFGEALRDSAARGVEVLCFRTVVTPDGLGIDQPIEVDLRN